jgi:ankyrin repeat protein
LACRSYKNGNPEVVKLLLEYGADLHDNGRRGTPLLQIAAKNGNGEIVELLLDAGLPPDGEIEYHYTPLMYAADNGYLEIVKILIEKGAKINASTDEGYTALMGALKRHHTEIAKLLIHAGADVNAKYVTSFTGDVTILMGAIGYFDPLEYERSTPPKPDVELINLLIQKGADPTYTNKRGYTAMKLAKRKGYKKIYRILADASRME